MVGSACCAATSAVGQSCVDVLGTVKDTSVSRGTYSGVSNFKRFFCDRTFSSEQEASDAGGKVGVSIKGLPLSASGYKRSENWRAYQRSICESIEQNTAINQDWYNEISRINKDVIDAWSKCVNSAGVHFWADVNADEPHLVLLNLKYVSSGAPFETTIRDPLTVAPRESLDCDGAAMTKGTRVSTATLTRNCERKNDKALNITVGTDNGTGKIEMPAIYTATTRFPVALSTLQPLPCINRGQGPCVVSGEIRTPPPRSGYGTATFAIPAGAGRFTATLAHYSSHTCGAAGNWTGQVLIDGKQVQGASWNMFNVMSKDIDITVPNGAQMLELRGVDNDNYEWCDDTTWINAYFRK